MAVSSGRRRPRYRRCEPERPVVLTPVLAALLAAVGDFGLISLPQLARLRELSEKATRRHMRALFDAGLVDVLPVPRDALREALGHAGESFGGSAPNLYQLTAAGAAELRILDPEFEGDVRRGRPRCYFLAHTLLVGDVRIWLTRLARRNPHHALERWASGPAAHLPVGPEKGAPVVRPDAWCVYRLGGRALNAAVEADRATERLPQWKAKLEGYAILLRCGRLPFLTGYARLRVLVIAPDARRRDRLAELIAQSADGALAGAFWLAEAAALAEPDLARAVWRRPGQGDLVPLVAPELLPKRAEEG